MMTETIRKELSTLVELLSLLPLLMLAAASLASAAFWMIYLILTVSHALLMVVSPLLLARPCLIVFRSTS
jgi:hypothetical protein